MTHTLILSSVSVRSGSWTRREQKVVRRVLWCVEHHPPLAVIRDDPLAQDAYAVQRLLRGARADVRLRQPGERAPVSRPFAAGAIHESAVASAGRARRGARVTSTLT
jgi:hypothetical protein